ncbi:Outer cell wall protein precursor [compost metagenome]
MVVAAYTIDLKGQIPTVASYKVVDANNVEFTLSNQEVVKVKLDKALEANKETAVEFKDSKGNTIATKVTYVVTTATKVASVSASNLKQVNVAFDGEVDANTATDVNNYSIAGKTLESASLSADKKTVTLTLNTTTDSAFKNQQEYKLTFNNVKAGTTVLSTTDYKFTPVDSAIPTATTVTALGNTTLKVEFSEPVKTATASNFLIDGKQAVGYVTVKGNSAIIKLFTKLDNGQHTVNVKGVEDFVPFKSLSQDLNVSVVEDTTAPTIASVEKATFETVRVKFSEAVDPATVLAGNVYWVQGTAKQYPKSVTYIADDIYEFDFSNAKIQYTTDLFIGGVKDYSGNAIAADSKIQVNPTVDQTRPEVVNVKVDSSKQLTVKFSKVLDEASATNPANYVIKDADGKEVSKTKTVARQTDNKVVVIQLAQALTQGKTYTLAISGVSDNTTLKNVILPYSTSFTVADSTAPTVVANGIVANNASNTVSVTFSKQVAVSGDGSAVEKGKYLYSLKSAPSTWKTLPDGANLNISADGKSVLINFPSDVKVSDIDSIRVQLVKDLAGNYIDGLTEDQKVVDQSAVDLAAKGASATATNKVEVTFGSALLANSVSASDFEVRNGSNEVLSVIGAQLSSTDSKVVVLTLADGSKLKEDAGNNTVKVTVRSNATTSTPSGLPVAATATPVTVADKIAASIDKVSGSANGNSITINFNEAVAIDTGVEGDLVIKDTNGNIISNDDYTVTAGTGVDANKLTVAFDNTQTGVLTVSLPAPRYIKDAAGNVVKAVAVADALEVEADTAAPTVSVGTTNTVSELDVVSTEALFNGTTNTAIVDGADVTAYLDGAQKAKIASAVYTAATKTITITFKTGADVPADGDVISTTNLEDKDGNSLVNSKFVYNAATAKWVQSAK